MSLAASDGVSYRPARWADIAVAGFLLTAGWSYWTAFDRGLAAGRLLGILGSAAVYYGLSRSSPSRLWECVRLCGGLCTALAGLVVLPWAWEHGLHLSMPRWIADPLSRSADIETGLVAVLLPFLLAGAFRAWQQGELGERLAWTAGLGLAIVGLLVSDSAGAMLASILGGWGWLWLAHSRPGFPRRRLGLITALALGAMTATAVVSLSGGFAGTWETLRSRARLARASLALAEDFRFTGGGLGSFAGLYARYILIQPNPFYGQSYNLLLDLTIEQGLPAAACFLALGAGSLWAVGGARGSTLPEGRRARLTRGATAASLVSMLSLGLVHDPFAAPAAGLLLLVGPGFAASIWRSYSHSRGVPTPSASPRYWSMLSPGPVAGLAAGLVAGVGLWPWGNLQAQFHANLGAVSMARVELEGWPGARREDAARSSRLADAEAWFESSLASDPDNPTASFRMGLIALDRLEFADACAYLENAWMNAERHRGVRKALGYCYTWLGRLEQAVVTLAPIPEAARELRVQARVWRGRGRPDLAQWATEVSTRLEASG